MTDAARNWQAYALNLETLLDMKQQELERTQKEVKCLSGILFDHGIIVTPSNEGYRYEYDKGCPA